MLECGTCTLDCGVLTIARSSAGGGGPKGQGYWDGAWHLLWCQGSDSPGSRAMPYHVKSGEQWTGPPTAL